MRIENNKLVEAKYKQTPNTSGSLKSIKYIVAHDDIGASMAGTESWILNPASKVSYHVLVGKNGEVTQFVEFNKRAYHCGVSEWKGLTDLNWYTIGVCLQNKAGEPYTEKQIQTFIEVCKTITKTYPSITEIVKHKEIAPKRKTDPNNHYPTERINKEVFGGESNSKNLYVTADTLNVRSGAGTVHDVVIRVNKGDKLHQLSPIKDGWVEVLVCESNVKGFVSATYVK